MGEREAMSATIARISRRPARGRDVREIAADLWDRLAGTPGKRRALRRRSMVAGPVALAAAGLAAWLILRPTPQPDYARDNLRRVFSYTLLSDEFNKLPVDKRLELIRTLVDRVKNMSAADSALVAAFAAGIAGAAREQLEENMSRLAIDMWYEHARRYDEVPTEDRGAYLDHAFLEMTKAMEAVAGETRDVTDAERLAEARRQAQRDLEMMRAGRGPSSRMMARLYTIMRDDVGSHASGAQKSRGQLMLRDMVRRLRGEGPGGG